MIDLIRTFFLPNKSIPAKLYSEALRNENSGDIEKAIQNYQTALDEINKSRFYNSLKIKITEKLKVLNTVNEFDKNFKSR